MEDNGLTIDLERGSRAGMVRVVAKLNGQMLHADEIQIIKAAHRERFVTALRKKAPALDRAKLEDELVRLADTPDGILPANTDPVEIDFSRIVKPERFITPAVSGLTVSTVVRESNRPVTRWTLCLRWSDGRRESADMVESIDLPDGTRLWLSPVPANPPLSALPQWSACSRKAWLDDEPSPEPSEVYKQILEQLAHYLELPPNERDGVTATLGLWCLLTYVYAAWAAVPYLYIGGPLGSGKSTVFHVLKQMVFRPLTSSSMSEAALFRTLNNQGGTLLLDEAERLWEPSADGIRSMLLAGYQRGGRATRLEPVGDSYKTVEYDVYGPKALACIKGLPPALASRCIPVTMFRAGPESPKPRRRIDPATPIWQNIRDRLHVLALEHGADWLKLAARSGVCPAMSGRNYELWQPILALAEWFESYGVVGLLDLTQRHALRTIEAAKSDQSPDAEVILLECLTKQVRIGQQPTPSEVLERAKEQDPTLFRNWTASGVGRALKRYGLETHKSGQRRYRDVTLDDLRKIECHYGLDLDVGEPAAAMADSRL